MGAEALVPARRPYTVCLAPPFPLQFIFFLAPYPTLTSCCCRWAQSAAPCVPAPPYPPSRVDPESVDLAVGLSQQYEHVLVCVLAVLNEHAGFERSAVALVGKDPLALSRHDKRAECACLEHSNAISCLPSPWGDYTPSARGSCNSGAPACTHGGQCHVCETAHISRRWCRAAQGDIIEEMIIIAMDE